MADVKPMVHGRWKKGKGYERLTENGFVHDDKYICSCCGWNVCCKDKLDWNFCPDCGAKMDGAEQQDMSNANIVFVHKEEEAPEEMVKQLPNCPVCGAKAYLHGDTVDGIWFGWSIGCPRYCLNDGIHGQDFNTPREEHLAEHGFATKEEAVEWWKRRAEKWIGSHSHSSAR